MPVFAPQDVYFPQDGDTVVELVRPYIVGSGELTVFLNGVLVTSGHDYTETDSTHITFNYQLSSQDVIVTKQMLSIDDSRVRIITDNGLSLFQRYGNEDRLMKNQKYIVSFQYGDKTFTSSFYSRMEPLYSTVETIRGDLGAFLSKITDFQIMYLIYENSILAQNTFTDVFTVDPITGTIQPPTDGVIPYNVKQFVRYRTELDLALQIYLSLMGQSGADHMVLGQLEVEKRFNLGDIRPLMDMLKARLNKYQRTGSPLVTAVKGGTSNPYPMTTPRRDFSVTIGGGQ